jgi:hypothetical protein
MNDLYYIDEIEREIEVKYKNSPSDGGISCYDVEFRIIGENGLVSVMLVQKGCYRWSEVTVAEVHQNGKFNDLSKLSADLSVWNTVRILNQNNTTKILNGKDTIFSCNYTQAIGIIKGIRLVTKGSGAFDYVKLRDDKGNLKFEDNFSNMVNH